MKILIKHIKKARISCFTLCLVGIVLFGLFLRLYPDSHEIIWSYDQARDSFTMREMVRSFDLKLIGPQTEYYGLFHGPLFYYLLGPFLSLSGGEVFLPVVAMSVLTLSSIIPLSLLIYKITKNKFSVLILIFVFSISYQFIEYGRWISNVSVAIPFLSWSYYFLYKVLGRKSSIRDYLLLGLALGLAIQGELFLISLAGIILLLLIFRKTKPTYLLTYSVGGILGVLPLVISEVKFGFRGTQIFFTKILKPTFGEGLLRAIEAYWDHLGITSLQVLGGITKVGAYLIIFIVAGFFVARFRNGQVKNSKLRIMILTIFVSHLSLFFFSFVNAVFLDMELSVLLILLLSLTIFYLHKQRKLYGVIAIFAMILFQIVNYHKFVLNNRPLDHFGFIQQPSTILHKEEILEIIYEYADDRNFTFASIGTPYGVRTVWASVFELYSQETGSEIPKWFGYYANGYPGEELIEITDNPDDLHVLLIESNIDELLAKPIVDQEISNQDTHTKVTKEVTLYDTRIQFREKI